jgi:hypothetical protein
MACSWLKNLITFHASVLSVRHKAGGTELADGFVFLHVAGRVGRASGVGAGVEATIISAGQISGAAAIPEADRERGVAVAYAYADRPVIHDLAALVLGTGGLGPREAGILALAVDAGRVRGTVEVLAADGGVRGAGELAELVNDEAVLADAHRPVVAHLAPLVHLAAVLEVGAGVAALAGLRVAGEARRAVAIRGAADARHRGPRAYRVALGVRVARRLGHADVALGTGAPRLVQHHPAEGVYAAGPPQGARVQALGVYARLLVRALGVGCALLLCLSRLFVAILFFNAVV